MATNSDGQEIKMEKYPNVNLEGMTEKEIARIKKIEALFFPIAKSKGQGHKICEVSSEEDSDKIDSDNEEDSDGIHFNSKDSDNEDLDNEHFTEEFRKQNNKICKKSDAIVPNNFT